MNAIPRHEDPDSIRGVYDSDDEPDKSFRNMPAFDSKAECVEYKKRTMARTNPSSKRPQMTQIVTFFVNWDQVIRYMLPKMAEYRSKYPFKPQTEALLAENQFRASALREALVRRLDLPFHKELSAESSLNTLRYMFHHMRCGIFVMIRKNKLVMFAPFVNEDYQNNWYHLLKTEPASWAQYSREKNEVRARHRLPPEHVTLPRQYWWANGNIMCNVAGDSVWGDQYVGHLKHMIQETCRNRTVPDCEFFINKRDYPHLKADLSEPYDFLFDADEPVPLSRERYGTYAPITSFYFSDEFADLPFVVTDDWDTATGKVFLPYGDDSRSAAKREEHACPWEEKQATALFRGSATGGGTTVDTNQRLQLAHVSQQWREDPRYNEGNPVDSVPFLDAGVIRFNFRDKKLQGEPMRFIDPSKLPFGTVEPIKMYQQVRYKYIVYVEGHAAASRYASMMKMGSVILKVESRTKARDIWYFPLLKAWEDHVPVKHDLSDLAEKIEWCKRNDARCREIAQRAGELFDSCISKNGIMDYLQLLFAEVSSRYNSMLDIPSSVRHFSLGHPFNMAYAEAGIPCSLQPPAFMPQVQTQQQQQRCHCDLCTEESIRVDDDVTKAEGVLPEVALRVKSAGRQVMQKRARPGKGDAEDDGQHQRGDGQQEGQEGRSGAAGQGAAAAEESAAPAERGKSITIPKNAPNKKLLALLSKRRVK